jgi:hypothetical protein
MKVLTFLLLTTIGVSTNAQEAEQKVEYRCERDQINVEEDYKGRLAWAARCGHINEHILAFYVDKGLYPTFDNSERAIVIAPFREDAPCGNLLVAGACRFGQGCYAEEARVKFGSEYISMKKAFNGNELSVTVLSEISTLESPQYEIAEVGAYVIGDSTKDIYVMNLSNGNRLRVTKTHPFVTYDGRMQAIYKLDKGSVLVGEFGEPVQITSLKTESFDGRVYNIKPKNKEFLGNVLVSEGVLTGSIRSQAEWEDIDRRILNRKEEAK